MIVIKDVTLAGKTYSDCGEIEEYLGRIITQAVQSAGFSADVFLKKEEKGVDKNTASKTKDFSLYK